MKPAGTYLHFEGSYRGVYRGGKVTSALGTQTFKAIDWVWLEVTPTQRLPSRNVTEEQVLDFYFAPQLPPTRKFRLPFLQGMQLLLTGPERRAFSGTIYDVVMTQHTVGQSDADIIIKDPNGKSVSLDALEISGSIRFSIPDKTVLPPLPTLAPAVGQPTLPNTPFHTASVNYTPSSAPNINEPFLAPTPTPAIPATPGKGQYWSFHHSLVGDEVVSCNWNSTYRRVNCQCHRHEIDAGPYHTRSTREGRLFVGGAHAHSYCNVRAGLYQCATADILWGAVCQFMFDHLALTNSTYLAHYHRPIVRVDHGCLLDAILSFRLAKTI